MKQRKNTKQNHNEFIWGWMFIMPTVVGLVVLNIIPIFRTLYLSFFKTGDFGKSNKFIGFSNYTKMIGDGEVWQALYNTLKYAIIEVPLSIIIALIIAALLNQKIKGRSFYRTIFFLPMIAAPAAIAMVWRWLYNSQFGLINNLFHLDVAWISNPKIAIFSIGAIGIWSVVGYNIVIFLAGLQEIPKDYYEASEIDGASGIDKFFHITLPLLSPSIFFVSVTRIIAAFQVFDLIFMVMEKSNPAIEKTQSLVYLFYQYSFTYGDKGYGATIAVLLLATILIVTSFQLYAQKKWVHYN